MIAEVIAATLRARGAVHAVWSAARNHESSGKAVFAPPGNSRHSVSDNFTLIRLCLAMAVVLSHSYPMLGYTEPTVFGRSLGNFAVHCFFVISRYLVSGSWIRSPGTRFVMRRAARLAPALVISHAFALGAAGTFDNYIGQPLAGFVHGSLWTISWEVLLYSGVTIFGVLWLLVPSVLGTLYAVGLLLIIANMKSESTGATVIAPLILLFVCGAFLRLEKRVNITKIGPVALIALVLLYMPVVSDPVLAFLQYWTLGFAWDVSVYEVRYFVYLLALPISVIFICAFAPASIGLRSDYSYGVFVFAWPVQQICVHYMMSWGMPLEPLLLFAVAGLLSLIIAIPLWHCVEEPISRWRYRQALLPYEYPGQDAKS
jgi:peptidoglycan/LPS O-acetylase OafA/YrhL